MKFNRWPWFFLYSIVSWTSPCKHNLLWEHRVQIRIQRCGLNHDINRFFGPCSRMMVLMTSGHILAYSFIFVINDSLPNLNISKYSTLLLKFYPWYQLWPCMVIIHIGDDLKVMFKDPSVSFFYVCVHVISKGRNIHGYSKVYLWCYDAYTNSLWMHNGATRYGGTREMTWNHVRMVAQHAVFFDQQHMIALLSSSIADNHSLDLIQWWAC